jgi:predicted phosphodiesterase
MITVFSDIHANEKYLSKALPIMNKSDAIIFLGDAVGYRKNPAGTLKLLKDNTDASVLGNHDAAAVDQFDQFYNMIPAWMGATLKEVKEVDDVLFNWLKTRPHQTTYLGLELVHGSFKDPLMGFLTVDVSQEHFKRQQARISLVGHTHQPLAIGLRGNQKIISFQPSRKRTVLDLSLASKWALNPGSLGIKDNPFFLNLDLNKDKATWRYLD